MAQFTLEERVSRLEDYVKALVGKLVPLDVHMLPVDIFEAAEGFHKFERDWQPILDTYKKIEDQAREKRQKEMNDDR